MATLQQVRDKANAKLATFWSALQTREDAYFVKHGKYFQLIVGSALTVDGEDTPFSVVLPSDEPYVVDIDTSWSDTVPFKIQVHEWVGNDRGYTAYVSVLHGTDEYQRRRDSQNNDSNWFLIDKNVTI